MNPTTEQEPVDRADAHCGKETFAALPLQIQDLARGGVRGLLGSLEQRPESRASLWAAGNFSTNAALGGRLSANDLGLEADSLKVRLSAALIDADYVVTILERTSHRRMVTIGIETANIAYHARFPVLRKPGCDEALTLGRGVFKPRRHLPAPFSRLLTRETFK